jgi:hypothetical protein
VIFWELSCADPFPRAFHRGIRIVLPGAAHNVLGFEDPGKGDNGTMARGMASRRCDILAVDDVGPRPVAFPKIGIQRRARFLAAAENYGGGPG